MGCVAASKPTVSIRTSLRGSQLCSHRSRVGIRIRIRNMKYEINENSLKPGQVHSYTHMSQEALDDFKLLMHGVLLDLCREQNETR